MSFGKQSAVHNHLSTKLSVVSRRGAQEDPHEAAVEQTHHDEGRFAERAPPDQVAEPEEVHSHA